MNQDKKTLIILIPGFPENERDSTCVPFPQSFVKNLKQINPLLHIIVFAFQYPFSPGTYDWHGVEVHAFSGKNRGKFNRLLLWKTIWNRLEKIMKGENVIGILSFWMGECGLIAKYAARKHHLRSFIWIMGQDAKKNNRYVSLIKPAKETLIALSDFIAEEFFRNYKIKPANTIAPGLDISLFPPETRQRDIDIMGAGSLIPLKRYDQFVKLIAGIAPSRPDIRAVICGDGPERKMLEQQIHEYKLNDHIELTGELEHERVLSYMQRSKIFLHPSSYEGFGMVCAEALYAGARVVSYCKPMNSGFNHQYNVMTEEEMERKVKELLEIENLNQERVLTYPMEECCRQVISLYS